MSALTADKGHICVFSIAYKHGEGCVLLIAVSSRHVSLVQNHLVIWFSQSTSHKAALHLLCTSVSERWGWGQRSVSIIMSPAHVHFMHPWFFKLCALEVKGTKLLPFHEEMNGAFMSRLWPKHLKGFVPSRLFLIAGKIDHSGTLMQPFYLQRKYKILFPLKSEESDNILFLWMQFQSF